jgi:hypothetical protein
MTPAQRDISRKLRIFNYAKQIGNVSAACRHFGISREIYVSLREPGLTNLSPCQSWLPKGHGHSECRQQLPTAWSDRLRNYKELARRRWPRDCIYRYRESLGSRGCHWRNGL